MKYLVIGDIHGDFEKLKNFNFEKYADRKIIFLGDYVNRGNNSKAVIDFLINIEQQYDCIFLMGNHDYSVLQFIELKNFYNFAILGGIETIQSYNQLINSNIHEEFLNQFPKSHFHFFQGLVDYYEDENYFFSHSGINPQLPNSRKFLDLINNSNFEELKNHNLNRKIVCGHFIQDTKTPFISSKLICIDTGCGTKEGPLTFFLLPEEVSV